MKTYLIAAAACCVATPALAGDVTVTLTGVKAKGGVVFVSLDDEKTFMRADAPFIAEAKAKAGDVAVTFRNVPAGDYAVVAFHDADGNTTLTMGPDGRMGEGTAISNAETLRAMPTFATTKVAVPAAGAALSVAMSYPEDRTGW